jgi:transaldolase
LNITAILTTNQVRDVVQALDPKVPSVVSVFAGRIADTGRDPMPIMKESLKFVRQLPNSELLWASVREVLNVVQAELCGCDIVTVPPDILKKARSLWQKDLAELSLDTVKMFADDAIAARFEL